MTSCTDSYESSKMADDGAENLRKQIAFLSSLIDSHKSGKHEKKSVLKSTPSKNWSRWKTKSAINKNKTHLAQNEQLNERQQGNKILDHRLSRKILNASNVKGYVSSNKLNYRNVPTNNTALLSSTKVQNSNTSTDITWRSKHNVMATSASSITAQFHISQLTNQQKSEDRIQCNLHRKIKSTKSVPLAPTSHISSLKTIDQKILTKAPLSSSYSGTKTPLRAASITDSSGYSNSQELSNERQPVGNIKWTKNERINSGVSDLKSSAENERMSSNCTVIKPSSKNPSVSSFRHAKPIRKSTSLPASYTRSSANQSFQNLTMVERNTLLPKTKSTNTTKNSVQPTAMVPKGAKLKWRRKSASQLRKDASQNLLKTQRANSKTATKITNSIVTSAVIPKGAKLKWRRKSAKLERSDSHQNQSKTHRTSSKTKTATTAAKTSIQQAIVTKGPELKWRRRSASQLRKDCNKNPKSKNLFGNNLQTHMALKSKWQRSKPGSTMLRSTVHSTGSHHFGTSANGAPKNGNGKKVIRSHRTKNILQLRTVPRRTRLKWSKSLSQTAKSDEMAIKKVTFAYKSRFSLKRRKSNEGTSLGVNGGYLGSRRVQHGAVSRVKSQDRGFVARRMKYIALGSYNQIKSLQSPKYSFMKNAPLRRKITVGGNHYIISSRGMTLTKTTPSNCTKFSTAVLRKNSLRVNRKPVPASSNYTIHRIIKRQNSVDMNKTRTANKILKRTLQNVQAVMKKQPSKEYCMFYNKFGKCTKHKQGICPYIHDPTKIAVCTRFLRGKCQQMDGTCPFSHKIDKEKMPICQYFLKGKCNRDDCLYSHVNVGPLALVCEDFLKGYCALGYKCKRKHVLECEDFSTTGQCANGNKCKLFHREKVKQRRRYFDEETLALDEEDNIRVTNKARRKSSEGFLPLEGSTFSEDELLNITNVQTHNAEDTESASFSLRIRPNFTSN